LVARASLARAEWPSEERRRNVVSVMKIVGVAALCALLLAVFLWIARRGPNDPATGEAPSHAPTTSTAAVAVAVANPLVPATATAPVAASATGATQASSDQAACTRIADLCSTSGEKVDVPQCETKLSDSRKLSGAGNVDRSETCIAEAKTCAAATGCISGGIGVGALGEFLKGVGSSLSK
jgi:hypothetical protein